MSYVMQARSSVDGQMKTWVAGTADWAGVGFPGPGTPEHVAIAGRYVAPGAFSPAGPSGAVQYNAAGDLGGAAHASYIPASGSVGAKLRLRSSSATTGGTSFEILDSAGNVVANMTFAEAADPNDFFTSLAGAGLFQVDAFNGILELKGEDGIRARTPEFFATVLPSVLGTFSLANGAADQSTFNPSGITDEEFPSGYYQAAVTVLVKRATGGDYRSVRLAFDFVWDRTGNTITLIGDPQPIDGPWDSTGLTVEVDVTGGNTLRITTTNGTGQTTAGRIMWSYGRQPLL